MAGDNIQCITERVKQLLKELFAAHVELATEAKKWKKKCQKNRSNETSKCSPSLFDVSIRSGHSSSFLNSPFNKDKAAQTTIASPVNLSNCNPCVIQKSLIGRNEITVNSNKPLCKKITENDGSAANDIKKTDAKSPCDAKTNKLHMVNTDKSCKGIIQKLSSIFDVTSDSERDFQSPEPFVPSWKRRELTRPPLVIPDTEPIDCEDFKTSTPYRLKSEFSKSTTFKPETDCLNSPEKKKIKTTSEKQRMLDEKDLRPFVKRRQCGKLGTANERSDSTGVSETLREFISPSPDKKKLPKSQKFLRKQTSVVESCKIKRSTGMDGSPKEDTFSFLIQSPDTNINSVVSEHGLLANDVHKSRCIVSGETVKRELGSGRERDTLAIEQKCLNSRSNELETKGFDHQLNLSTDEELQFSDSFDPDETYCPITREKEMLEKQRHSKATSSLNNASMIPGLRLSQYCTVDPDQTMDHNFKATDTCSASEASLNTSNREIKTPSPFPSSLEEPASQELIAFNPTHGKFVSGHFQQSSPVMNVNTNLASTKNFSGSGGVSTTTETTLDENEELTTEDEEKENTSNDNFKKPAALDDSFNRVPPKHIVAPEFAYVDVVRKRSERNKLDAFACDQCKKWYDAAGLTEEEMKERMKSCRHRSKFEPTSTPEHYWSIGFPDTEACKERGYVEVEDDANKPVSRARRKRAYRKIF